MNKYALVAACVSLFATALPLGAAPRDPKAIYFDYDEFITIRALDPSMADARLSGMNKACMRLWKNGDLLATEHGMVVRADFDGDGQSDVGIAMEKDKPAPDEGLDYFIMAATKTKDGSYKLMETVPLKQAHAVIEISWDDVKKAITVDTGERQLTSESTVTMLGDGKLIGGWSKKTGDVEIQLTYLRWNNKEKKFDSSRGMKKT